MQSDDRTRHGSTRQGISDEAYLVSFPKNDARGLRRACRQLPESTRGRPGQSGVIAIALPFFTV
jgi:hypothetical protein